MGIHSVSRHPGLRAGAVAGLVVLVLGLVLAALARPAWTARAALLVLPQAPGAEPYEVAGLYETLSRGQVAATYAELLREPSRSAAATGSTPVAESDRVSVQVEVVPDTSVLEVRATSPDRALAERVADSVARSGEEYLNSFDSPYSVTSVSSAEGSSVATSFSRAALVALAAFLALVAAVTVQQVVQQLDPLLSRRPRRSPVGRPSALPVGDQDAAGDRPRWAER